MNSRRKNTNDAGLVSGSGTGKVYSQDYDDEENAADIEDADKGDDEEEEHSGSQVRKQNRKKGVYQEDINGNGINSQVDLKKKFHFQINKK